MLLPHIWLVYSAAPKLQRLQAKSHTPRGEHTCICHVLNAAYNIAVHSLELLATYLAAGNSQDIISMTTHLFPHWAYISDAYWQITAKYFSVFHRICWCEFLKSRILATGTRLLESPITINVLYTLKSKRTFLFAIVSVETHVSVRDETAANHEQF